MSKFGIYGAPRPGVTPQALAKAVDAVVAKVVDKGVTDEELARSKTRLIADAVYAHDSQASMARWYGDALMTGATVADVAHWPDRIRAVTADQVKQAARRWLEIQRSVTGYLVKDKQPAGGETFMTRLLTSLALAAFTFVAAGPPPRQ